MCIFPACGQIVFGVVMVCCLILTAVPTFNGKMFKWDCIKDIKNCETITVTVAIFMCLALAFEIIALAWNAFVFCACCCKKYLIHPLSILSLLVTIMLLVAVIVYAVNNKDTLKDKLDNKSKDEYGYSFWLSVCALVLAAADTVIAGLTVCLEKRRTLGRLRRTDNTVKVTRKVTYKYGLQRSVSIRKQ